MKKVSGRRAAEARAMHTTTTARVDANALDAHITDMYRDVARGATQDLHFPTGRPVAAALGYPGALLDQLPAEAVDSFAGVGYHLGLAGLRRGERVLDLGSGSGMDVFAAALQVGAGGSVTGVDMTPEQLENAERLNRFPNVAFRRARIEELPFPDASFDVVISNGVVNLSPRKRRVFAEVARVLRRGGRLALADIVTERGDYLDGIAAAGLVLESVVSNPPYVFTSERARNAGSKYGAHSISLLATKPHGNASTREVVHP
jgi:SAM-dependent methyltransferase